MDISVWLRGLGLEQYASAFAENAIAWDVLSKLTADDLKEIGISAVGDRRRLLEAIAALSKDPTIEAAPIILTSAERRQLTVMFCDLVGSTSLAARLDPEDLRDVIGAYHGAVAEEIKRFGGYIAKYMGDGVLVYFGYPQAHEDDAERAVRAGLAAAERIATLDSTLPLETRVGIATGLVVVGDLIGTGEAQERGVVGETPNLAARLQDLAPANGVLIAEGTRRLLGTLFEYRELRGLEVKGFGAPILAWHVLQPSAIESRFEALRGSALGTLVGRDEEIELLLRRWTRAKAGDGQIVLVSGEPGIGKSRLVAALAERLVADPYLRLRYFCSPYHQDSALYPFIDQLARASGFGREDTLDEKLKKLEALLGRATPPDEDVAFLAELLSLAALTRHPLPNLSPQRKKERTLEALIRQLEGLAHEQPVVMVFEDSHWIDPTSRELLDLTIERVRSLPVLLIVTFRPEFQAPWTGQPQVSVLALNRLDLRDRTDLIKQIAGDKALPDTVVAQIADRTDGVPLFVEELTKSVLESGVPLVGIPATLHDLLMARLDRLASARHVAQIGAAIGREFSYELLRDVSRLPEDELQTALGRLVASELILQRGRWPDAIFAFKHALVQDAAHGSLLRRVRQQLHEKIAIALEAQSPELMESQPELFAQHYAEAGLFETAVAFWGKAGHRSAARSAMAEAAAQFQRGIDQLSLLPETPERQRQELEFSSALGAVLQVVKGFAAPETGRAYARARGLWEQLGAPVGFLRVPFGQSLYHMNRGELDLALRFDEDLLRLSRQRNDTAGLFLSHQSFGRNLLFSGRFTSSRSHLEEAIALYDPTFPRTLVHESGTSPQVASQAFLGNVLFCLGYPDQALTRSNASIAEARRLAHPPSLALSLSIGSRLLSLVGDNVALNQRAGELIEVAIEQGFPYWRALGTAYRGWVLVENGNVTEGISLLRTGSAAYRATGSEAWLPQIIGLLARAYEIAEQYEETLVLLDDALQIVERTGERWFAAELNRHKGRLLLRRGRIEAAEELYGKALSMAEEQEAKLWELRSAISLAELWVGQGRRTEARDLLAPIYAWFTEGFDTADLKKTAALLELTV